jgi:hypothetical protein
MHTNAHEWVRVQIRENLRSFVVPSYHVRPCLAFRFAAFHFGLILCLRGGDFPGVVQELAVWEERMESCAEQMEASTK